MEAFAFCPISFCFTSKICFSGTPADECPVHRLIPHDTVPIICAYLLSFYSIIQKDSNIRFDFALRLANELEIDVNEICSASPFSGAITEEEIYPTLPNGLNGALDGNRVKTYLKNSMYPLMYLFGKNSMPDVDNLLTSFYQLDDEARKEVVETIQFKLQYHRDPERAEQIKQIKGW